MRPFIWLGYNKETRQYVVSEPLDTVDLIAGNYPSFFRLENRKDTGTCQFIGEIRDLDVISFYSTGIVLRAMIEVKKNTIPEVYTPEGKQRLDLMLKTPGLLKVEVKEV